VYRATVVAYRAFIVQQAQRDGPNSHGICQSTNKAMAKHHALFKHWREVAKTIDSSLHRIYSTLKYWTQYTSFKATFELM
jgi:hypothetical protein